VVQPSMYGMHQGMKPSEALSKYAPLEASKGNITTNIASGLGCILFYQSIQIMRHRNHAHTLETITYRTLFCVNGSYLSLTPLI
jgi:hypothetical protein